jgi:glycosyltransferase involved in cell wall biosynthesis
MAAHRPRAILYSTSTAALLWPAPGAIHFDAPAAGNRPGRHGVWQRPVERRRFAAAPLLVAQSAGGLDEAPEPHAEALVIPVPAEPSGPPAETRDVAAVTYAADVEKKGLQRVLDAWARARREGEELVVAGIEGAAREGVRFAGLLGRSDFRELLRRARVYVTAPRREDYGLTQLEALADGCMLVTTPAPGPYAALPIARELDARLVADELAPALRAALDEPRGDYVENARSALVPFRRGAVDALVVQQLVPRLLELGGS